MADYKVGTADPPVGHDPGAGPWGSTPPELLMRAAKLEIQTHAVEEVLLVGPDAARHMAHYLGNSGSTLTVRLRNMVDDVPSGKKLYNAELELAKAFVKSQPDGTYDITSGSASGGYNRQSESRNWYFATGGYSAWGKGHVKASTAAGVRTFTLEFEYRMYDRYNWDAGKSVTLFGITITDHMMGEFHRQGLAKEYDCEGSIKDTYTWTENAPAPPKPPVPPVPPPKPPVVPPPGPAGKTYIVKPGDSLSKIAQQFYGNMNLWPKIYEANKAVVGPNPNLIYPGQKLTIP